MKRVPRYWITYSLALLCIPGIAQERGEEELLALGAVDSARLIREGAITSTGLVSAILARAKELNHLNAYITLNEDGVLKQAADADRAIADGTALGRLHGGTDSGKGQYRGRRNAAHCRHSGANGIHPRQ